MFLEDQTPGEQMDHDEELGEDDGEGEKRKVLHPLARKMWSCARRGVRSEEVWSLFAQRVLTISALAAAGDLLLMLLAFARIKYRDVKVLDTLSPLLLRHIDAYSTMELVLLLNAHKKLEYERLDNIELLLKLLCDRHAEWTSRHISLMSNAAAFFYIYRPKFWRLVSIEMPRVIESINALELSNTVSAMARVDRRDARTLMHLARKGRRFAERNLFSQDTLATSMNAFAKLDFNHAKLSRAIELCVIEKLDRALAMGPDYRASSLRGVDADVFDVQALMQVSHTLICLVGTSDEVVEKLLTLVSWSARELGDYQLRVLKTVLRVVQSQSPHLPRRLPQEVTDVLFNIQHKDVKVATHESRWVREVTAALRKMNIQYEKKPLVDEQVLDIALPTSGAAVYPVGPFGYYANSTDRTAYSKLHQRLLEMAGYKCLVVPYFEWGELKTEEDQMVYLWSLGRRVAAEGADGKDAAAAEATPAEILSDLSDLEAASPSDSRAPFV